MRRQRPVFIESMRATFANETNEVSNTPGQGPAGPLLLLLLLLAGCASVRVTPAKLAASAVQGAQQSEALSDLARWQKAVGLCNAFLDSPYRRTLPKGRVRLTPEGMEFVLGRTNLPVRVKCTRGGDLVVRISKLLAQERSDGFAVGLTPPNAPAWALPNRTPGLPGRPTSASRRSTEARCRDL